MDDQLMMRIEDANRSFNTLVDGIDDTAAHRSGQVGTWSLRETLAHIIAWQEEAVAVLAALREGTDRRQAYADEDAFNSAAVGRRQQLSWHDTQRDFHAVQHQLMQLARDLPDALWANPKVANWLQSVTIDHYAEHQATFAQASQATARR